ncbi:MAG: ORF6N domain-containing protein [Elusimicrobiota bacterium]|jgi:hypothetical protein
MASQEDRHGTPIERKIYLIRGQRVMLDRDLAELYGVTTTRLNQQTRRNILRFPADFMFELSPAETNSLMLHFATSKNRGRGGRRKPPLAFTEHGAIMLAAVLNTPIAVTAGVQVVRAFIRLRDILASHKRLSEHLCALESRITAHDAQIMTLFDALAGLREPAHHPHRKIGFHP